MTKDFKVIAIISGRGSNLKALLDNCKNCTFIAVVSNKSTAPGLQFAKQLNIPTYTFDRSDYKNVKEQKSALFEKVIELAPDLVTLAGYMQIIPENFTNLLAGKIINIHPSLLPKYKGLDTHKQVLESDDKVHGCSVHLVTPGLDEGEVIAQVEVPILNNDTEDDLAARVLVEEHRLYPWVVNKIASGEINLKSASVSIAESAKKESLELEFLTA